MEARVSDTPLLEFRNLAVHADGICLLSGIDLAVGGGEIVAVTGPSGCGKTSLLRVLACLDDAAAGEVRLEGRSPEEVGWPAYRRCVMLLPQRPVMFDGTIQKNLERAFCYRTAKGAYPAKRAEALLDRLDIGRERLAQDARSLSEGQQQRVALIRALLAEPSVLLLDEPTSALDARARGAVEALIEEEVARRGLGVIVVTHDAEQATQWSGRQYALDGHVVAQPRREGGV